MTTGRRGHHGRLSITRLLLYVARPLLVFLEAEFLYRAWSQPLYAPDLYISTEPRAIAH